MKNIMMVFVVLLLLSCEVTKKNDISSLPAEYDVWVGQMIYENSRNVAKFNSMYLDKVGFVYGEINSIGEDNVEMSGREGAGKFYFTNPGILINLNKNDNIKVKCKVSYVGSRGYFFKAENCILVERNGVEF